jgi:hypothetical protein
MPALFGYLIALSILLGGGYAGLQWLAAPDPRPAKPVAHRSAPEKTASSTTGTAPTASQANRNSGTVANSVPTAGSDKPVQEQKAVDAKDGKIAKSDKGDGAPAGGCRPIGLTSSGDLVFSMQCQELIERHHDFASSATNPPASGEDRAREATPLPDDAAKVPAAAPPNNEKADGARKDTAHDSATADTANRAPEAARTTPSESSNALQPAPPSGGDANGKRKDAGPAMRASTPKLETPEVAREPNGSTNRLQATLSDHTRTGKTRSRPLPTAETKPNNPEPELETASRVPVPPRRPARAKPAETISKTVDRAAGPSREERSQPTARQPNVTARADTEWYNVLGLR